MPQKDAQRIDRLVSVTLDETSIGRGNPDQEHERQIAIWDLVEENCFSIEGHGGGPYALVLALQEKKLLFDVRDPEGAPIVSHFLSLTPFRSILRDYFMVCESYYAAIRTATPSQIMWPRWKPSRLTRALSAATTKSFHGLAQKTAGRSSNGCQSSPKTRA